MTSSNGNIPRVTGPLWGESTGPRWIPPTKYSDAGLWCFLWSAPEQTIEQPVIWDVIALIIAVMAGKISPWDDKQTQYIAKCWVMTWKKFPGRNLLQKTTTYKRWWVLKHTGRKAGCCIEDKQPCCNKNPFYCLYLLLKTIDKEWIRRNLYLTTSDSINIPRVTVWFLILS